MKNYNLDEVKKVIEIINLNKHFNVKKGRKSSNPFKGYLDFRHTQKHFALKNISLSVYEGEVLGIIGANGSGKSTLLNIIIGSYSPDDKTTIKVEGKVIRLALGMGVDPQLSVRENIYVNASVIGLTFRKTSALYNEIIEFAGIKGFEDYPVKHLSKGMRNRLLFSIAIHAQADIYLLDEFFGGVGDEDFKAKSNKILEEKIIEKKTILLVSHSLQLIKKYATRCVWIDKGRLQQIGKTEEIIKSYINSFQKDTINK